MVIKKNIPDELEVNQLAQASQAKLPPVYAMVPVYAASKSVQADLCTQQCVLRQKECEADCDTKIQLCQERQRLKAQDPLENELREQLSSRVFRKKINVTYEPVEECAQNCSCAQEFQSCFRLCGGKVTFIRKCIKNCSR